MKDFLPIVLDYRYITIGKPDQPTDVSNRVLYKID